MDKVRLTATDFIPLYEKCPIGRVDKNGKQICYGHTVRYQDQEFQVVYRYGTPMLKKPFEIACLVIAAYEQTEVLSRVTGGPFFVVVGHDDEQFIKDLALILDQA